MFFLVLVIRSRCRLARLLGLRLCRSALNLRLLTLHRLLQLLALSPHIGFRRLAFGLLLTLQELLLLALNLGIGFRRLALLFGLLLTLQ